MVQDNHNFPQDQGTGVDETVDWDDAGAFAQFVYDINTIDYVLQGFDFTVDWTNGILNVSGGVARLSQPTVQTNDHTNDDGPPARTLDLGAFLTQAKASGDKSLTDNAVNHVYIAMDQSTNDRTLYRVNTDGTKPAEPSLKIGTVDTSSGTYDYVNRLPTGRFASIEIQAPPQDQT